MRFVAFGCSHTWGDGILPGDSWDTPPSSASWVQVLSKKFNVPVLNLADSGGSNLLILHAIRNHDWQAGDIAVIQWTYFERSTIFDSKYTFRNISNYDIDNKDRPHRKQYYTLFPKYHIEYISLENIEHAYLYLAVHSIPMVARFTHNDIHINPTGLYSCLLADFQKPTLNFIAGILHKRAGTEQVGADNMHFNPVVHQLFADEYVHEITKLL
jgi:hypothetical protein|tara:strand:+ start:906 stop:1544 length:639 start_codon:yes stop_codon:yes gene_type:complete